jgi:hypothetical protein
MPKPSQPARKWNPKHAGMVRRLSGLGLEVSQVAVLLKLPPTVLASLYARELQLGPAEAEAKVRQALLDSATGVNGRRLAISATLYLSGRGDGGAPLSKRQAAEMLARTAEVDGTWDGLLAGGDES